MKPGDHPDFFRLPPPPGTSRESSLRLDREGQFWFEGERVDHPKLLNALHAWVARHPDDGRYILTNGYDWTYFRVDDVPFFVRSVREAGEGLELELSDGSSVPFTGEGLSVGDDEGLYVPVAVKGGEFEAKFTRYAQAQLEPWLAEAGEGRVGVRVGGRVVVPAPRGAGGQT
ncbi:MAG TPA: hypothetical protein VFS43_37650 [Polyangiaceae bacterium]|nr:hypothetical protein [Polyangiaceae bacterium]